MALLALAGSREGRALPAPNGWSFVLLPLSNSHARMYVPAHLDRGAPAPLIVFLHGAGSYPEAWQSFLSVPADGAGALVIAPRSLGIGWGNAGDENVLAEAIAEASKRALVDPRRVSITGHSAGGAYAYLIGYQTLLGNPSRFSGVFSMSAPYYFVDHVVDPGYTAPLRQYYGGQDPNYQGGARDALVAQWQRLGIPFEEDFQLNFGHSNLPPNTLADGFAFAARQVYPGYSATCGPTAGALCLRDGRYRAEVAWRTAAASGVGHAVSLSAGDSGLFWFFDAGNIEMLVKVLDGCVVNHRVWVFASATTNVGFTLTVTDTVGGTVRTYSNALGHPASIVTDTEAFATCP